MEDGALDDTLETAGRRGIGLTLDLEGVEFGIEIVGDGVAKLGEVDAAGDHHLRGMLVGDQGEQQMLQRRIFMAPAAGSAQRVVQRLFEFAGE